MLIQTEIPWKGFLELVQSGVGDLLVTSSSIDFYVGLLILLKFVLEIRWRY